MNLETDSTEADSARSLDVFYRFSDARLVLDVFRVRRQQLEMDRIEHVGRELQASRYLFERLHRIFSGCHDLRMRNSPRDRKCDVTLGSPRGRQVWQLLRERCIFAN
jgi:hypothetical protein